MFPDICGHLLSGVGVSCGTLLGLPFRTLIAIL
jgi:hypothetical protein